MECCIGYFFMVAYGQACSMHGPLNYGVACVKIRKIANVIVTSVNTGIQSYSPANSVILTPACIAARLVWCSQYLRWIRIKWQWVTFADESRFHIRSHDGRVKVLR